MVRCAKRFGRFLPIILSLLVVHLSYADLSGRHRGPYRGPLSGETIFRGLFFGTGPVAAMFPEIWESPHLAKYAYRFDDPDVIEMENRLVNRLRAETPGFFMEFAREMRTGDQLRIQEAMRKAAKRLRFAAAAEMGVNHESLLDNPTVGLGTSVAVVIAVALILLVAAVAVLVWVDVDVLEDREILPNMAGTPNDLRGEMYVQMIADRLVMAE